MIVVNCQATDSMASFNESAGDRSRGLALSTHFAPANMIARRILVAWP